MSAPRVRPGLPEDAPRIAAIQVASWREAYRGMIPDAHLDGLSVVEKTRARRETLSAPASAGFRTWVVEREGTLRGFASTAPSRDPDASPERTAELLAIYLDPPDWAQGLGTLLLEAALAELAARGFEDVTLWVIEANAGARRFYERRGFLLDPGTRSRCFADRDVIQCRYRRPLAGRAAAVPA